MPLNPGDLNRRIEIRRQVPQDDGHGGFLDGPATWQPVATVWAEVIGLSGRESVIQHTLQGITVYRIRIRYRTDISAADQVRYNGADLNIRSIIDPDGGRETLTIIADTGGAQTTA
ncbi:MAG TPA: phage head closure protein [Rhizomicrobium sp.]|jgi:SPP1 family predicted phage head-tail adaptor|nr:phage head closure protein [Rhizomicrobium sp.]